jgi:hypothetical protein
MDASIVRILCGLVAVALLALIVMRRRARQIEED